MKAVIMAGGKGTRLRPLTCSLPKPMAQVAARPMMEHVVDLLLANGITDLACTLCFLPDEVRTHFGDGSRFGCSIQYSVETTPLGTAGSVRALRGLLDGTFVVASGDALTDISISAAIDFHRARGAAATLVLTRVDTPLEYGVVITDSSGRIERFLEKPSWGQVFSDTVNTGIYVLEPEVLDLVPPEGEFDFSRDLFPRLLKREWPLFGYVADGYWCDVGCLEQYRATHYDILEGRARVHIGAELIERGVWVGDGAVIEAGAVLKPPVIVSSGCWIEKGAEVGDGSVLGTGCVASAGCRITRSVLWPGAFVGAGATVTGGVIGSRASIKARASIGEGAVVGSGASVGEGAKIAAGVKIWPDKVIDGGARVYHSLVWSGAAQRRLFGSLGVSGVANVDLTPAVLTRAGAAYASCMPAGAKIALSRDAHPASSMAASAFASGVVSAGTHVVDHGVYTTAVARYTLQASSYAGGAHIRVSPADPASLILEFLDSEGIHVDRNLERKIENAYTTEDSRRAPADGIGAIVPGPNHTRAYLAAVASAVDTEAIRRAGMVVAGAYDAAYVGDLVVELCRKLGITLLASIDWEGPAAAAAHAQLVRDAAADFGFIVDRNAERLALIDEQGGSVSEPALLALTCAAAVRLRPSEPFVVPVTAPASVERLAKSLGGSVLRAPTGAGSVLRRTIECHVGAGGRRTHHLHPVVDGLFALALVADYLAATGMRLSEAASLMPQAHTAAHTVECPWTAKGRVMRSLIERTRGSNVQLIDGIRVESDEGQALILPDSDRPVFQVYTEAFSQEAAEEIALFYAGVIRSAVAESASGFSTPE